MSIFVLFFLGVLQGVTEFLPVSSSGHLVLFYKIFNITDNLILLSIILHVATLLAIIIVYRKQIWQLIKKPLCKTNINIIIACIPTVCFVLIFEKYLNKSFGGDYLIYGFLITALVLFITQFKQTKTNQLVENDICNLNVKWSSALIIGFSQGIACFPGISRSGSTIAAGILCGTDKNESATFSFLLSIPIITGSLLYEVIKAIKRNGVIAFDVPTLTIGFISSFLVGIMAIKIMLKFVKENKLSWFSYYLLILCVFLVLNEAMLKLF